MIGTVKEINLDILMTALGIVITQETDGDEDKQEQLRRSGEFTVSINFGMSPDKPPLVVIGWDEALGSTGDYIIKVTDDRDKWRTWPNELGLRLPEGR
jgi:hypothetical protein